MAVIQEIVNTRPVRTFETEGQGIERRCSRRHDMELAEITVDRWEGGRRVGTPLGRLVDLSSNGIRIRTGDTGIRADQQIRLRLELPDYAGISPFIETTSDVPQPTNQWVGWIAVTRVNKINDRESEIAGRLVEMDEIDRGMLGLYLSTQPMSA